MWYCVSIETHSLIAFLRLLSVQKAALRKQVVIEVKNGDSVQSVGAVLSFIPRTIYRCLTRYALGGFAGLRDRERTGGPRKWTVEQTDWLDAIVLNKTPDQYQFEFALWTVKDCALLPISNSWCPSAKRLCVGSCARYVFRPSGPSVGRSSIARSRWPFGSLTASPGSSGMLVGRPVPRSCLQARPDWIPGAFTAELTGSK